MLKKQSSLVTFLFEKSCVQLLKSSIMMQKQWTEEAINQGLHLPLVFFIYASFGISLVLFSSCLVLFWAPAAAGGGVNYVFHFWTCNKLLQTFFLSLVLEQCFSTGLSHYVYIMRICWKQMLIMQISRQKLQGGRILNWFLKSLMIPLKWGLNESFWSGIVM